MKRERLEDLGIICEKLRAIIDTDSPLDDCTSKHSIDGFIEKYKEEEKMVDLHNWLRWHRQELDEIYLLAKGYEE